MEDRAQQSPNPRDHAGLDPALAGRCRFRGESLPDPLPREPMETVARWLREAADAATQPNPNAVVLATTDRDGKPSARVVLARGFDAARGFCVIYTNYHSRKGRALEAHPDAALVFHWDHLDRQVRIEGPAARSPAAESDAYFNGRPLGSRLGAWASRQSEPLADRADLLSATADAMARFGVSLDTDLENDRSATVPRPPHWGGYRIWARRVELWLGDPHRLHDRAVWERPLTAATIDGVPGFTGCPWTATRLQPYPPPTPTMTGSPQIGASMRAFLFAAATVFLISSILLVALIVSRRYAAPPASSPLTPDEVVAGVRISDFALTTQDGRDFSRADLLGRVTIIDFMFTNCPFICPLLTARMAQMADQLQGTGVRFVSVTVDPSRDSPAVLAAYAREREIDTARWSFLTGDFAVIRRIVADELKFALEDDPGTPVTLPDGSTMSNIIHPGHFVLVGPGAEVLGVYAAKDDAQIAALVARARAADRLSR